MEGIKEQLPKVELIEPTIEDIENHISEFDWFFMQDEAFRIGVEYHKSNCNYLKVISILESRIAEYKKQSETKLRIFHT